ncbi:P27 family predicted phage terminase small subunit [Catenulispora sp. GAS73]|uniref:P27 family phage terminase small subunit n=1 Tax=Catenulispora sp. GAS73 TaxID=3156269 RepID=UPI0035142F1B
MPTGRPPTPTERKRRTGNPGKRALPDAADSPALPALALDAPDHLGAAGRAAWMLLAAECSWLAHTDRVSVVLLCEKLDRRAAWIAQLAGANEVLLTDKGYAYPNPLVGMLSTLETEIVKLLSLLGLTPADRTRIGLGEVRRASKLAELLADRHRQNNYDP